MGRSSSESSSPPAPGMSTDVYVEALADVLEQTIMITINGRRKRVTLFEAYMRRVYHDAERGDRLARTQIVSKLDMAQSILIEERDEPRRSEERAKRWKDEAEEFYRTFVREKVEEKAALKEIAREARAAKKMIRKNEKTGDRNEQRAS